MFHFTSWRLARALMKKRREGVPVRILLDAAQADAEFVAELREQGLEVRRVVFESPDPPRFHHKYCVLDDKIVVTGSYNWTFRGDTSNHENLVVLRDAAAARKFTANFEAAWNDARLSRP